MAQTFKDYYKVLGVSRTASDADIKKVYHRLAREHHPDLHPEKEKQARSGKMKEVNEAYAVLSSKENRAKYDQLGAQRKNGPPPQQDWETGGSSGPSDEAFSDFFRNIFRQRENQGGGSPAFSSELDIEAVLDLSLEDAVRGVEKSFSLMTTGLCQTCHGTGQQGKGFCSVCGGVGEVRRQREVRTKIPGGLTGGIRIRLKGKGNEGPHGSGDLYLQIRLLPHPRFKVDGLDLETGARIMPWQAGLGSKIDVQTLDGSLGIRLPKGTHTGTRLRLSGKGLGKTGKRGDLFVRIEIDIPEKLTPKVEALLKQLEEESNV